MQTDVKKGVSRLTVPPLAGQEQRSHAAHWKISRRRRGHHDDHPAVLCYLDVTIAPCPSLLLASILSHESPPGQQ